MTTNRTCNLSQTEIEKINRDKAPLDFIYKSFGFGTFLGSNYFVIEGELYETNFFSRDEFNIKKGVEYRLDENEKWVINNDLRFYNKVIAKDNTKMWNQFWKQLEKHKIQTWQKSYYPEHQILDGGGWSLTLRVEIEGKIYQLKSMGENAGPFRGSSKYYFHCNIETLLGGAIMRAAKKAKDARFIIADFSRSKVTSTELNDPLP